MAITFGIGMLITLLSVSQIRSLFQSLATNRTNPKAQLLPIMLVPGLAGILLMLPGLLSDLLAGVVVIAVIIGMVTGNRGARGNRQSSSFSYNQSSARNHQKTSRQETKRVIDVDYEAVDDKPTTDTSNATNDSSKDR